MQEASLFLFVCCPATPTNERSEGGRVVLWWRARSCLDMATFGCTFVDDVGLAYLEYNQNGVTQENGQE